MISTWKSETRNLECRWVEVEQRVQHLPRWMQGTTDIPPGYLSPLPDFASRNPFGGGTDWFQLHSAGSVSK